MCVQKDLIQIALDLIKESFEANPEGVLWMDAATGAGNTTLKLARLLKGKGELISIDKDESSWTEWAYPKLERENLLDVVKYIKEDLVDLSELKCNFHGIFTHATLSVMGYTALDAVSGWRKLLRPDGRLIILDALPQEDAHDEDEEIANFSWNLIKAVNILEGQIIHDEFPPEFWLNRLKDLGFSIEDYYFTNERKSRSEESLEE